MAVGLAHSTHVLSNVPGEHLQNLGNIAPTHSTSAQRLGFYLDRDTLSITDPLTSPSKAINMAERSHNPEEESPDSGAKSAKAKLFHRAYKIGQIITGGHDESSRSPISPRRQGGVDGAESENETPPPPPPKDYPVPAADANEGEDGADEEEDDDDDEDGDTESYADPTLSRTNSVYSIPIPRQSFKAQLSRLTSLKLPDTSSLASEITAMPTAVAAAKALSGIAEQIQRWIQQACEVLAGLDADDDVDWIAAAGREALEEAERAASNFESLIGTYVAAIEQLQLREDIAEVSSEELETVVEQMELTMVNWKTVRRLLKGVKEQVELAMEWQELWDVVLGDISLEVDALGGLIFEMEEKRHQVPEPDTNDNGHGFDIGELETIVEETPLGGGRDIANHRFSLPPAFPTSSPTQVPSAISPDDDTNLMALFARLQPLRASLDFVPMRLSNFVARGQASLPSACKDLEDRRLMLEKKWVRLHRDAETLKCELSEDRWVLVFRNAGRQAKKMCESVERSVDKLQEAIDTGAQHSNPASLAKKVDNYEAKKMHYGPAIERVLAIIEKGLHDRRTVNGEILLLNSDLKSKWAALEASMRDMDVALDDLNLKQSQQLRDSLSSIMSTDRSTLSAIDTPRSSPASSIVMGPTADSSTPGAKAGSRRGSFMNSSSSRAGAGKRYCSMPPGSAGSSSIPRKAPTSLSGTSTPNTTTPTPASRYQRPSSSLDGRPRWSSSGNMNGTIVGHNFKPLTLTTPSPHRRTTTPLPTSSARSSRSSIPLPSPLGPGSSASPSASTPPQSSSIPRAAKRASSVVTLRDIKPPLSFSPPTNQVPNPPPSRHNGDSLHRPKLNHKSSSISYFSHNTNVRRHTGIPQQAMKPEPSASASAATTVNDANPSSPPTDPKPARPSTAMAAGRRNSSMLPQPKGRVLGGRDSSLGGRVVGGVAPAPAASAGAKIGAAGADERRWR